MIGFGRYALGTSLTAFLLAGCGGSQPMAATTNTAVQPTRARAQFFRGYYSAKFTEVVGSALPFSSLCLRFTPSGAWRSVPPNTFSNGTYFISNNELFASAQAPWSPVIYATLQGSINGTQSSGYYIVMQPTGPLYSGGTFTLTRAGKRHC
jgi:hypothetical protein